MTTMRRMQSKRSFDTLYNHANFCADIVQLSNVSHDEPPEPGEFDQIQWDLNRYFLHLPQIREHLFDVINVRLLAEGIDATRWPSLIRDLRSLLRRGGLLQMVEFDLIPINSSSGLLEQAPNVITWNQWYDQGMSSIGKDPRIGRSLAHMLRECGYQDVRERRLQIPIGRWQDGMCDVVSYHAMMIGLPQCRSTLSTDRSRSRCTIDRRPCAWSDEGYHDIVGSLACLHKPRSRRKRFPSGCCSCSRRNGAVEFEALLYVAS